MKKSFFSPMDCNKRPFIFIFLTSLKAESKFFLEVNPAFEKKASFT